MGTYWRGVFLCVGDSGPCAWYDIGQPFEYICDAVELPDVDCWVVARVASANASSLHMHPSRAQPIGGSVMAHAGLPRTGAGAQVSKRKTRPGRAVENRIFAGREIRRGSVLEGVRNGAGAGNFIRR